MNYELNMGPHGMITSFKLAYNVSLVNSRNVVIKKKLCIYIVFIFKLIYELWHVFLIHIKNIPKFDGSYIGTYSLSNKKM